MYRPKEPEQQRADRRAAPAGSAAGRPFSLLDLIERSGAQRDLAAYTSMAAEANPAPPQAEGALRRQTPVLLTDDRSNLQHLIHVLIRSLGELGPADVLLWVQHRIRLVVAMALIGALAALGYAVTATPRYTVHTDLIVDPQNLNVVTDDVFASSQQREAQLLEVESRLRVLTSRNVLRQVIADLDLTEDPEFNKPGLLQSLTTLASSAPTQEERELAVLRQLSERVSAGREERSFVVVLSVWSESPEKAVQLSESIVRAFEAELFQSAAESAGRVAAGLTERLDELRYAVTEAEEKVEAFRRENDLQSTAGELANSRISSLLDTQVVEAQQRAIQAEARFTQMQTALDNRQTASAAVFDSPAMTNLRASYNTLRQEIGSLSRTYGARHPRLIALQSEQAALETALADEAQRILQSARTEMDQAKAALSEFRDRATEERSTVYTNNDAQVRLRELQREAQAKAAVYETFLARTHQITERQQIDTTNVRVISPAVPPRAKSWPPRTVILVGAGTVAGIALGIGLALLFGLTGHLRRAATQAAPQAW
nr:cell shape-determining protein [Rhizobium sp. Q54]